MRQLAESEVQKILNGCDTFRYQMLGRLQSDCNYYLGWGNRNANHALWAHDEHDHIELMKLIYDSLEEKPVWLTMEQIKEYEKQMITEEE